MALAVVPSAAQDGGDVLFMEEFEDPNLTLLPDQSPNAARYQVGYVQGEYVVRRTESALAGVTEVPVPGEYADAALAVDVRVTGGAGGGSYIRLTCRGRANEESEYRLLVQPGSRQFRIERRDQGIPAPLVDWRQSNAIRAGADRNQLALGCFGARITATANGEVIATVQDGTYTSGRMEIGVFSPSTPMEARFDNLYVVRREAFIPTPMPTITPVPTPTRAP
jgi:hypothetical protein